MDIENSANITNVSLNRIYRVKIFKTIRNISDGPMVATLKSPYEKNNFLYTYSKYKRSKGIMQLFLRLIGFDSDASFYVNENLTP